MLKTTARAWLGRGAIASASLVALAVMGLFLYAGLAADVDNWLGWYTSRDLRFLQSTISNGQPVRDLVAKAWPSGSWTAFHPGEEAWLTIAQYRAVDGSPGRVFLSWEVAHVGKPHPIITALSRSAVVLTPEFRHPNVPLSEYPSDDYPVSQSLGLAESNPRWK